MAVFSRSQSLILPVAPLAATVIGVLTAAMFALVPTDLLESMVVDSGIASVLSAAEPPLGLTALGSAPRSAGFQAPRPGHKRPVVVRDQPAMVVRPAAPPPPVP